MQPQRYPQRQEPSYDVEYGRPPPFAPGSETGVPVAHEYKEEYGGRPVAVAYPVKTMPQGGISV